MTRTQTSGATPRVATPLTASPDPAYMADGAGTAAQQAARPRRYADHANGGWGVPATGATAGTPGTFTPAGAITPGNLASMAGIVATPATPWTVGQRVITADAAECYWSGSAWVAGRAPALETRADKTSA